MPQQNIVSERTNHTIIEIAKNMLHAQKLDKSFCADAMVKAVYTQNSYLTNALYSITCKEAWSGRRFCIAYTHVFGCVAYTMVSYAKNISSM